MTGAVLTRSVYFKRAELPNKNFNRVETLRRWRCRMLECVDVHKQTRGTKQGKVVEMTGRIIPERIAHLKRRSHKIFAMYEEDPDEFWLQHAMIRDMGARDHGADSRVEYDEETSDSG